MSSSRRESRSSLGNRQNDALFEYENFKKKFLLANKHITKLNSTLSVRIEELNAQISMLYVENLRLRASEIALASQLKREREQSRKILADAEAASQTLTKHLTYLRESLHTTANNSSPPTPPSPKARRPPVILDPILPQFRIARPPNVPGIYEDEEPSTSSAGEQDKSAIPTRKKLKPSRLSISKLPIPARGCSPTPPSAGEADRQRIDLSNIDRAIKPRRTIRRQSGLLKVNTASLAPPPRSGSPAFGSPIRLEAALAEAEEEAAVVRGGLVVLVRDVGEEDPAVVSKKEKRKGKSKEQRESESEKEAVGEKRKLKELVEEPSEKPLKPKSSRTALRPIDSNVEEPTEADTKSTTQRQFLRPPSPSHDSSSPIPEQTDANGREKRVRKSVNYAEPKLNTKMRKPDPPPGSEPTRRKRSSVARTSTNKPPSSSSTPAPQDAIVDADTGAAQPLQTSQMALPLKGANDNLIEPENFPIPPSTKPGSAAAMYSPGPPSRTTGSTSSSEGTITLPSSSSTSGTGNVELRQRRSRPQLVVRDDEDEEEESDGGADADSEYAHGGSGGHLSSSSGSGLMGGWSNVNVDSGRRRGGGLPKRSAAAAAVAALEDMRRHSMVI